MFSVLGAFLKSASRPFLDGHLLCSRRHESCLIYSQKNVADRISTPICRHSVRSATASRQWDLEKNVSLIKATRSVIEVDASRWS